jgi:superinfection exclusion protein B
MSDGTLFSKLFDWFKPTPHTMTVVLFVSLVVLILNFLVPPFILEKAHVASFLDHYLIVFWLTTFFSGLWLLTLPFFGQSPLHRRWAKGRRIKRRLKNLADHEKQILRRLVAQNEYVVEVWSDQAGALEADGILEPLQPIRKGIWTYGSTSYFTDYVKKHRNQVLSFLSPPDSKNA